ncbi:MAG TPA: glutamate decarboxylase [Symbiobacteriaceae bacterium]
MWQVIYVAPNKHAAEQLRDALSSEGILVSLRAAGVSEGSGGGHVELLVPRGEAREANEILNLTLGRARYKK